MKNKVPITKEIAACIKAVRQKKHHHNKREATNLDIQSLLQVSHRVN